MNSVKRLLLTVIAYCVVYIPTIAYSYSFGGINCVLQDLDDSQGTGGDLWQATYSFNFTNNTDYYYLFDHDDILAINFNPILSSNYQAIEWVDNELSPIWSNGEKYPYYPLISSIYFESQYYHNSYDDLILGDDFSIRFIWTGSGDPGANQTWAIYEDSRDYLYSYTYYPQDDGDINVSEIIHLPTTVPEPSTLVLFGIGIVGIASCRRRARKSE